MVEGSKEPENPPPKNPIPTKEAMAATTVAKPTTTPTMARMTEIIMLK